MKLVPVAGPVTPTDIIAVTAAYYGRTVEQLLSRQRHYPLTEQRQVAMYLCRELTALSLPMIGEVFDRDHATILYAHRRIGRLTEKRLRRDVDRLKALLAPVGAA